MSQRLIGIALALLFIVPSLANAQLDEPNDKDPEYKARQEFTRLLNDPTALLWDNAGMVSRLAQARFDADQAKLPDLIRAWRAAAENAAQASRQLIPYDILTPHEHPVAEHLRPNREGWDGRDALASLEAAWRHQWQLEHLYQTRVTAGIGMSSRPNFDVAREARLALQQQRARHPQAGKVVGSLDDFLDADDPLQHAAITARNNFEAEQTSPAELARARVAVAQCIMDSRLQELLAGRVTTEELMAASKQLLDARRGDQEGTPAPAALESYWLQSWETERVLLAKLDAGTARIKDCCEVEARRLAAEAALIRVNSAPPREHAFIPPELLLGGERYNSRSFDDHTAVARARFEAEQNNQTHLTQGYQVARQYADACLKEFAAGRLTYGELREARHSLFLAHRERNPDADLAPLLEKRWREAWLAETMHNQLPVALRRESDLYQQSGCQLQAIGGADIWQLDGILDDILDPMVVNGQKVLPPPPPPAPQVPVEEKNATEPINPAKRPMQAIDRSALIQRRLELERELSRLKERPKN